MQLVLRATALLGFACVLVAFCNGLGLGPIEFAFCIGIPSAVVFLYRLRDRVGPIRGPKSKALQLLVMFGIGGPFARVGYEMFFHESTTASGIVGNFVVSLMAPYLYGAFWSGIPFVAVIANLGGVAFALMVLFPAIPSKGVAQGALGTVMILSLFTLWIEPWTSPAGAAVEMALTALAGVVKFWFDLLITVAWCLVWASAFRAIGAELPEGRAMGARLVEGGE
jgi:hypothetical protein